MEGVTEKLLDLGDVRNYLSPIHFSNYYKPRGRSE